MRQIYRNALTKIGLAVGAFTAAFSVCVLLLATLVFVPLLFPSQHIKNIGSIEMSVVLKNAIRAYYVDHGRLPPTDEEGYLLPALTTPINYIADKSRDQLDELPVDPFNTRGPSKHTVWSAPTRQDFTFHFYGPTYRLVVPPAGIDDAFIWGLGPDGNEDFSLATFEEGTFEEARAKFAYDPSNGTISGGDHIRGLHLVNLKTDAEAAVHSD